MAIQYTLQRFALNMINRSLIELDTVKPLTSKEGWTISINNDQWKLHALLFILHLHLGLSPYIDSLTMQGRSAWVDCMIVGCGPERDTGAPVSNSIVTGFPSRIRSTLMAGFGLAAT